MEREERAENVRGGGREHHQLEHCGRLRIRASRATARDCVWVPACTWSRRRTLIEAVCKPKGAEVGRRKVPSAVGSGGRRVSTVCGVHERERVRRSELECESGVVSERVWTSGLPRFRVSQCATGNRSLGAENVDTLQQFSVSRLFFLFPLFLPAPWYVGDTRAYICTYTRRVRTHGTDCSQSEANEPFLKVQDKLRENDFTLWMILVEETPGERDTSWSRLNVVALCQSSFFCPPSRQVQPTSILSSSVLTNEKKQREEWSTRLWSTRGRRASRVNVASIENCSPPEAAGRVSAVHHAYHTGRRHCRKSSTSHEDICPFFSSSSWFYSISLSSCRVANFVGNRFF